MENTTIQDAMKILKFKNKVRRNVDEKIAEYGYENIEPSFFEKYDSFNQFHGRIKKEKTVKVINNKGEIEILRPDITLNIIKNISKLWNVNEHIRLSYDSTVFSNNQTIGIVETRQVGAESLGSISIDSDVEVINLSKEILESLDKTALVIGNTKYLRGLLNEINVSDEIADEFTNIIYKKNYGQLNDLLNKQGVREDVKEKMLMLISNDTYNKDLLYKGFLNLEMREALREIEYINTKISKSNRVNITYDLGLVSEFSYYDGIIFKGFHPKLNKCFLKGGRYDRLSKLFNKNIPAVGFSMDLDEYMKVIGGFND